MRQVRPEGRFHSVFVVNYRFILYYIRGIIIELFTKEEGVILRN